MDKTTILISKNLRDCIKIGAAQERISMQLYLEKLVMKDLGLDKVSR